jgi:hypothetical protein
MKIILVIRIATVILIGLTLSACVSQPSYDYSALRAASPLSILILPPKNLTPDVKATYSLLAQMTKPLAEAGYYVVPVALMDAAFKENGVYNPDEAQNISAQKLRSIFGADAALYTDITEFGNTYRLITAETVVAARCKLIDLRTGTLLWEGSARASSAEQQNTGNNGGLAGLLIQAAVQQIANSMLDNSYTYAGITSQRLLSPHKGGGLLPGPRSPLYDKVPQQ